MELKNATNLVVIDNNKILLLKRNSDDENSAGKWCLPGGNVELGENFEQAVIRELKEETCLETDELKYFKSYFLGSNKFNIRAVYFYASIEGDVILNDKHVDFKWIELDEELFKDFDFAFNQRDVIFEFLEFYHKITP